MIETRLGKPGRPFGVTLAILVSVVLYSLLPLTQISMILYVKGIVNNACETSITLRDTEVEAVVCGGEFTGGITDAQIVLQIGIAFGFAGVAYLAWRGKPAVMRYVLVGAVLLSTIIRVGLTFLPLFTSSSNEAGASGGSLAGFWETFQWGQTALMLFISLYVVWYLNRAPARAFYRGYYLDDRET